MYEDNKWVREDLGSLCDVLLTFNTTLCSCSKFQVFTANRLSNLNQYSYKAALFYQLDLSFSSCSVYATQRRRRLMQRFSVTQTVSFFLISLCSVCLRQAHTALKKIKCDYGGQRSEEGTLSHKVLLTRGQNKLPALICGAGTNVPVSSLKIIMEVCSVATPGMTTGPLLKMSAGSWSAILCPDEELQGRNRCVCYCSVSSHVSE